jgi:hypothetical protein
LDWVPIINKEQAIIIKGKLSERRGRKAASLKHENAKAVGLPDRQRVGLLKCASLSKKDFGENSEGGMRVEAQAFIATHHLRASPDGVYLWLYQLRKHSGNRFW